MSSTGVGATLIFANRSWWVKVTTVSARPEEMCRYPYANCKRSSETNSSHHNAVQTSSAILSVIHCCQRTLTCVGFPNLCLQEQVPQQMHQQYSLECYRLDLKAASCPAIFFDNETLLRFQDKHRTFRSQQL